MKNGYLSTIVFILALSLIFGSALAGVYAWLKPTIETNAEIAEKRAILEAFALDFSGSTDAIADRFSQSIEETEINGLSVYQLKDETGTVTAYAVPFSGSGLWGTIRGYLAVSGDLEQVVGLTFTEQNETPGLGGRIDEPAFKEQFRSVAIDYEAGFSYGESGSGQLDAITGATSTSNAVLQMLNRLLQETLAGWEVP